MGASVRSLALKIGKSVGKAFALLKAERDALPHNNSVTVQYCHPQKFGGVIVVDGKYVAVKGYDEKIPFLWGIDHRTHDIPVCMLAPSESYQAWLQFFTNLKNTGYHCFAVVCDDNEAIRMAAHYVYPKALLQLCHVHFLENVRRTLKVRSDDTYKAFVKEIEETIFKVPLLGRKKLKKRCFELLQKHKDDAVKIAALQYVAEHRKWLTGYVCANGWYHQECPKTTNMIESYNKHLQGRLKTIQGFESFASAEKWLSAYALYRRLKPFTDCTKKWKKLNGFCSMEKTLKKETELPDFFAP